MPSFYWFTLRLSQFLGGFLSVALTMTTVTGSEQGLDYVDVYTAGMNGYHCYCIPTIEVTPNGTLLAFSEGRLQDDEDPGMLATQDVDLILKRSTDGGRTWSEMEIFANPGKFWSAANASTVVDRDTGKVWVIYLRGKPGRNTLTSRPGTYDTMTIARWSDDNGMTWSDPIDLTAIARNMQDENWTASCPGPGGGIQTRNGRLIIPCWKFPWHTFALYSDNHGKNWHRGELVPGGNVGNECQLVELANGQIMMDMRQTKGPRRKALSSDGGITWSTVEDFLPITQCACAIERLTLESNDEINRILWTGPKGPGRVTLMGRISYDEGKTFTPGQVIYKDKAGYSDLVLLNDNNVGCLWERNNCRFMSFTLLPLKAMEPDGPPKE